MYIDTIYYSIESLFVPPGGIRNLNFNHILVICSSRSTGYEPAFIELIVNLIARFQILLLAQLISTQLLLNLGTGSVLEY